MTDVSHGRGDYSMIEELRKFRDLEKKKVQGKSVGIYLSSILGFFFLCVDACCLVKGSEVINRRKEKEKE